MARTRAEWKSLITDIFMENENIKAAYQLTPGKTFEEEFSSASLESILFGCIAYVAYFIDSLFDLLKADVTSYISSMKPHSLRWYAEVVKRYQHGFALISGTDDYDNAGKTEEEISASKIVKYSAVVEQENDFGRIALRIKLATESGSDLAPLSTDQLAGVREYMKQIKDAGVPLQIDSLPPDSLKMAWTVYYNPLILNAQGDRLDGSATQPVREAIKNYIKALPFNGTFALAYVTDAVQAVSGVVIPKIDLAQFKYGNLEYANIDTWIVPDAGYLRFINDEDLVINYIAQSEIR